MYKTRSLLRNPVYQQIVLAFHDRPLSIVELQHLLAEQGVKKTHQVLQRQIGNLINPKGKNLPSYERNSPSLLLPWIEEEKDYRKKTYSLNYEALSYILVNLAIDRLSTWCRRLDAVPEGPQLKNIAQDNLEQLKKLAPKLVKNPYLSNYFHELLTLIKAETDKSPSKRQQFLEDFNLKMFLDMIIADPGILYGDSGEYVSPNLLDVKRFQRILVEGFVFRERPKNFLILAMNKVGDRIKENKGILEPPHI